MLFGVTVPLYFIRTVEHRTKEHRTIEHRTVEP